MDNILKLWKDKLAQSQAMYQGPVQLPLHSADVKTVLEAHCPDEFKPLLEELQKRTPTHVLLYADQVQTLLEKVAA
jgi:hypothetical protein